MVRLRKKTKWQPGRGDVLAAAPRALKDIKLGVYRRQTLAYRMRGMAHWVIVDRLNATHPIMARFELELLRRNPHAKTGVKFIDPKLLIETLLNSSYPEVLLTRPLTADEAYQHTKADKPLEEDRYKCTLP